MNLLSAPLWAERFWQITQFEDPSDGNVVIPMEWVRKTIENRNLDVIIRHPDLKTVSQKKIANAFLSVIQATFQTSEGFEASFWETLDQYLRPHVQAEAELQQKLEATSKDLLLQSSNHPELQNFRVRSFMLSKDGRHALVHLTRNSYEASKFKLHNQVYWIDLENRKLQLLETPPEVYTAVAFHPDGFKAAVYSSKQVEVINLKTQERKTFALQEQDRSFKLQSISKENLEHPWIWRDQPQIAFFGDSVLFVEKLGKRLTKRRLRDLDRVSALHPDSEKPETVLEVPNASLQLIQNYENVYLTQTTTKTTTYLYVFGNPKETTHRVVYQEIESLSPASGNAKLQLKTLRTFNDSGAEGYYIKPTLFGSEVLRALVPNTDGGFYKPDIALHSLTQAGQSWDLNPILERPVVDLQALNATHDDWMSITRDGTPQQKFKFKIVRTQVDARGFLKPHVIYRYESTDLRNETAFDATRKRYWFVDPQLGTLNSIDLNVLDAR